MKFRLASGLASIVACTLALSACSSMHMPHVWPFYKKPKPAPVAVNELNLVNADGSTASFPQYWKRNTLVIDLSGAGGAGSFAARLPEETTWPVRLAVRVRPGSVGQIEIQGEERSVLPVSNEGTANIDLDSGAQRVHAEDGGYLHFLGADTGIRRGGAGGSRSGIRVADGSGEACFGRRSPQRSAGDIIAPAEAQPAQPSPPPGA